MFYQDVERGNGSNETGSLRQQQSGGKTNWNWDSQSFHPNNVFYNKEIRRRFIAKVFTILSLQLVITFGFVAAFATNSEWRKWAQSKPWLLLFAVGISFVVLFMMICCEGPRRRPPLNYICLAIFTLAEGFVLGVAASRFNPDTILLAVAATSLVCLSLTLFALQTRIDFTVYRGMALILLIVLLVYGIVLMLWQNKTAYLIYSAAGTLIFSFYFVMDVQMVMGGHRYQVDPQDYVYACLTLYLDIVNLFLYILVLINNLNSGG